MSTDNPFAKLEPYLVKKPKPIIGAETIQIILMREILDYTILRTEETRETNTVHTPLSINTNQSVRRVAFLATKQKAAESRELEKLLRTACQDAGLVEPECFLKDNLCMQCPRCGLFGGTSTVAGQKDRANIKRRIEYSTAFSLLPFDDIGTSHTFNAINDRNQTTGQALGQRFAIQPATLFPSVITLKSVTKDELIMTIKTLLACRRYGAESRIGGDIRNTIWNVVVGWEEVITSLELTLELADKLDSLTPENIRQTIENKYKNMAGNPSKVSVLSLSEVDSLVNACANTEMDRDFLVRAYKDIAEYRKIQMGS